jgi:hypothetical protein
VNWKDYYRRRDALNAVLEQARRDPDGGLPFTAEAAEVFGKPADLLLALHYKWTMALTGRLGVALSEAESDPDVDPVDAVAAAWRTTAAGHPELRRLLDEGAGDHELAMRPAIEGEQRLLALSAGLAGPAERTEDVTDAGAALLALVRDAPQRRRGPVEQLLRRLVPSA